MHAAINFLQAKTFRRRPLCASLSPLLLCPCREELTGRWKHHQTRRKPECTHRTSKPPLQNLPEDGVQTRKAVLNALSQNESGEAEEVCNILCAMSKNVWNEGVMDWHTDKPLLSFHIVQPWLQAKTQAVRLYGETGKAAWAYADKSLKDCMAFELAMFRLEA